MRAHGNYLSLVQAQHVREWLAQAASAGASGVRVDFDGNRITRVTPQDAEPGAAVAWGTSGTDLLIPANVDVMAAVRDLNESGEAQRELVADARARA